MLGNSKEDLEHACAILLGGDQTVTHFGADPGGGIRLYLFVMDKDKEKAVSLPYKMNAEHAANMFWNWLKEQSEESYGKKPDLPGSVGRAFQILISHGGWDSPYILVEPAWAEFHK
jgi:hypothetical protein